MLWFGAGRYRDSLRDTYWAVVYCPGMSKISM
jgi:hypothetical protein